MQAIVLSKTAKHIVAIAILMLLIAFVVALLLQKRALVAGGTGTSHPYCYYQTPAAVVPSINTPTPAGGGGANPPTNTPIPAAPTATPTPLSCPSDPTFISLAQELVVASPPLPGYCDYELSWDFSGYESYNPRIVYNNVSNASQGETLLCAGVAGCSALGNPVVANVESGVIQFTFYADAPCFKSESITFQCQGVTSLPTGGQPPIIP